MKNYQTGNKIKNVLENVNFYSSQQCKAKEERLKGQLLNSLNNLKWPKDPQKVLKDKLKLYGEDEKK